jgi:hypothetical protein
MTLVSLNTKPNITFEVSRELGILVVDNKPNGEQVLRNIEEVEEIKELLNIIQHSLRKIYKANAKGEHKLSRHSQRKASEQIRETKAEFIQAMDIIDATIKAEQVEEISEVIPTSEPTFLDSVNDQDKRLLPTDLLPQEVAWFEAYKIYGEDAALSEIHKTLSTDTSKPTWEECEVALKNTLNRIKTSHPDWLTI